MILPPHGTNDKNGLSYVRKYFKQEDIQTWDVSYVTDMYQMFSGCTSLTSLDLTNWDTSKVKSMQYMFYNCSGLTEIKMGGDVIRVNNTYDMFTGVASAGTFYYNSAYDYSLILNRLPSTWTAIPCTMVDGVLVPNN